MSKRRSRFSPLVPLCLVIAPALLSAVSTSALAQSVQSAAAASFGGRVTNLATGDVLPGASVRLAETGRELVTDDDGAFLFSNLAAGSYTLVVSYEGLDQAQLTIALDAGATLHQDVRMASADVPVEEIQVMARRQGQAAAINLQRTAPSIRTVISADALGQIREGNIGDALVRLPGLSVETRAGVQRTATIRGLAPQYNTVTVDGLRMTNVDGNRDIALDSFPSNLLSRVEVVKSPTSDMSADAIGGTVNLVTRSAYDAESGGVEVEVGTTYNDLRDTWNTQAGVTYSDVFGDQDQFGALGSIFYFRDERGYDVVDTAYTLNPDGSAFINRALYFDREETKDKIGAGFIFDFRPTDQTRADFKAIYHYDYRDLLHRGTDYRPNPNTQSNVTPTSGSSTGGRVDSLAFYREPKNVFQMYSLGMEQRLDVWTIDGRLAYSRAKKDYPVTLQVVNSFNGVDLSYDRSDRDFPVFTVDNDVDLTDPDGIAFRQFDTNQVPRLEDEWTLDFNAGREFVFSGLPWSLKTGARATFKDASQAQPATVRFTGLPNMAAADFLEFYSNGDFMSESNGRGRLLPFFPDWRQYLALQQSNPGAFTQSPAAVLFSDQTLANADFAITENIYATYAMTTVDIGRLELVAGVRAELTEIESQANEVVIEDDQVSSVNPLQDSSDYTNVLPGIHGRYMMLDERLVLRASVTQSISRAPPGDLIPSRQENAQLNQRIIGNPDLEPAESDNFDLTAEYYFPRLGVLSAGVFRKDIDNFVFSSSRTAADGVDERTRVNGDGGTVHGLELVWVQQLTFLPEQLKGFAIEANYTYLDSEGVYLGRESEDLELVNSPRYILNGILSYARGPLSVRLSYSDLPKRLESVGARSALDRYNDEQSIWDVAASLNILERYNLFLNVKNLSNEPSVQYQGTRDNPTNVTYYGTQFNLGVKADF